MEKKLVIEEKLKYVYLDYYTFFNGNLSEIKKKINNLEVFINEKYEEVFIKNEDQYKPTPIPINPNNYFDFKIDYDNYDGDPELTIYGIRYETDEELSRRKSIVKKRTETLKKNKLIKQKQKIEKEKLLFEKLKEKYGK